MRRSWIYDLVHNPVVQTLALGAGFVYAFARLGSFCAENIPHCGNLISSIVR